MMSNNIALLEKGLKCISQLTLEKENKLIFKRFILNHSNWSDTEKILIVDCLLQLVESRQDINLLSILFSLFPTLHFHTYTSYLTRWTKVLTSKPCKL